MIPQNDGVRLDPQALIAALSQKVGESAIREAQMEAAIAQLQAELLSVREELATYTEAAPVAEDPAE